jgi:hypothetical protein
MKLKEAVSSPQVYTHHEELKALMDPNLEEMKD